MYYTLERPAIHCELLQFGKMFSTKQKLQKFWNK